MKKERRLRLSACLLVAAAFLFVLELKPWSFLPWYGGGGWGGGTGGGWGGGTGGGWGGGTGGGWGGGTGGGCGGGTGGGCGGGTGGGCGGGTGGGCGGGTGGGCGGGTGGGCGGGTGGGCGGGTGWCLALASPAPCETAATATAAAIMRRENFIVDCNGVCVCV